MQDILLATNLQLQSYNSKSNVWKGKRREENVSCSFWTVQCTHTKSGIAIGIWLQIWQFYFFLFKLCVIYFLFLSYYMVTKSSGNMLNMSDESGYLFLLLDIKGKGYSLSSLSTVLLATSYFIDVCWQFEVIIFYS